MRGKCDWLICFYCAFVRIFIGLDWAIRRLVNKEIGHQEIGNK